MGNYLVTGGTGQIGKFLCEELLGEGHNVVVFDAKPNPENMRPNAEEIKVSVGDVTDMGELLGVMRQNAIDHVVHLAAMVLLESMQHPAKAYRVNIMGTNNVFEAARLFDVEKVVFASSVTVYGKPKTRKEGVADEEDYPNPPADPYSTAKVADELMGKFYRESYGLDLNTLRIAAAWGPGRYSGYTGQFNEFIRKVATEEEATFPADFSYRGEKLRWMYVKDIGRCFSHVSRNQRTKSYLFNTGSRSPFNARDVVAILKRVFPRKKIKLNETDAPTRVSATIAGPNGLDVDCSKLYEELRFEPTFSLESALRDMVDFEKTRTERAHLPRPS